jgi:uncharacterized membrane protein
MLKWSAIVFGCGMLLILLEWNIARKKKDGVTWTDKKRFVGIFWVTCGLAALTAGLIAMS